MYLLFYSKSFQSRVVVSGDGQMSLCPELSFCLNPSMFKMLQNQKLPHILVSWYQERWTLTLCIKVSPWIWLANVRVWLPWIRMNKQYCSHSHTMHSVLPVNEQMHHIVISETFNCLLIWETHSTGGRLFKQSLDTIISMFMRKKETWQPQKEE